MGLLRAGLRPVARPQPAEGVEYAHKLDKAEARLQWSEDAQVLERQVRAFNPWPVAEAQLQGERVRIHAAQAIPGVPGMPVGSVLAATKAGIDIACGTGALLLLVVQREGGKPVAAVDYLNARRDLSNA